MGDLYKKFSSLNYRFLGELRGRKGMWVDYE